MRILLLEIRKILNWKMLIVLAFVNVILYYFLIDFDIKYFPNGRPALDSYRIGVEMVETYGPHMSETEIADFKKKYDEEVQKADQLLQSRDDFRAAGITSYEEFQNIDRENKSQMELHDKVTFEEKIDLFWELQERERLMEFHVAREVIVENEIDRQDTKGKERLNELKVSGQTDLYPEISLMNFESMIRNIAITVLMSVVLVISPIFLSDRSKNLVDLQYTAKIGRSLFKKKAMAGLVSAIIVITALLTIYLSIYSLNKPSVFFDIPINSFIGDWIWYDLTFFQYIMFSVMAIYMLGIILALIAMGISTIIPNYITLIGVQVPVIIALLTFGLKYLLVLFVSMRLPQWYVPLCYFVLVMIVIACLTFIWTREKKLDVV